MRDGDIDDILKRASEPQPDVDPALLDRISKSIGSELRPVRALPSPWILTVALILVCAAVGIGGAVLLGPHGIQNMNAAQVGLIFPALSILAWFAASLCVAEAIPGSRLPVAPWVLIGAGCAGLAAVFGLLFHDYRTEQFVSQGLTCLRAGVLFALPTFLAAWWILRRGYAVNPVAAGLAAGTLGGLAGLTMLEIHCTNFEAPHLMVWHIAVLPVSGALGALAAFAAQAYRSRRRVA